MTLSEAVFEVLVCICYCSSPSLLMNTPATWGSLFINHSTWAQSAEAAAENRVHQQSQTKQGDGSDPGSIQGIQSEAVGDRARHGAGDNLIYNVDLRRPFRRQVPTAKVRGPARRHPEAGLDPGSPMMLLRQGLAAQVCMEMGLLCHGQRCGWRSHVRPLRLVGALAGVQG